MPRSKVTGPRANVGVALIAKNSEDCLGRCLDSLRPYVQQIVVCVDQLSTDNTAKIARKHGADTVKHIDVSHLHTCARHGTVMAQHFANARNESFTYLDKSLDWFLWVDADDVFEHGDKIEQILGSVPEQCIGVWLPYRYSTLGGGAATNTVFHRERFLRSTMEWEWVYRVHEVVKPRTEVPNAGWFGTNELDIWHQEGRHRTEDSAKRNLLLLEIDLEQDPNDTRAIFYIGNQYFAMGQNAEAAAWYQRLLQGNAGNEYERWQAAVYMGHANLRMGNLHEATQGAYLALEERPEHPEPYFLLASVARMTGNLSKVSFWTKLGRSMQEPPFFVFKNPMDYSFNNRICLADALAAEGYIPEARTEWEAAYAAFPDPSVGAAIERAKHMEELGRQADRFVSFATYTNGASHTLAIEEYQRLPEDVRSFGRVRDVVVPMMLTRRSSSQPRIVFWCGKSWEDWGPPSLNASGLGGSETAVVEVARRFAHDGWRADVYNSAGRFEGDYNGVGYWDPERYRAEACDVFVSWRQPRIPVPPNCPEGNTVLWLHDLNYGPDQPMGQWGNIVGVSAWHAKMLRNYYDLAEVGFVPNGIDLARFHGNVAKVPMRAVYASSPDRGLVRLLSLWPRIREAEPGAELHVAYGWDTIDRMIANGRSDLADFKKTVEAMLAQTPGVTWYGRLPQDKLAELYQSAYCWAYPTDFLEVSCISAMEAMAGGCIPVSSVRGALPETVGDAGLLVPGLTTSKHWQDFWTLQVLAVLTDPNLRNPLSVRATTRAKGLTWDKAYGEHWKPLAERLLAGKAEAVCV